MLLRQQCQPWFEITGGRRGATAAPAPRTGIDFIPIYAWQHVPIAALRPIPLCEETYTEARTGAGKSTSTINLIAACARRYWAAALLYEETRRNKTRRDSRRGRHRARCRGTPWLGGTRRRQYRVAAVAARRRYRPHGRVTRIRRRGRRLGCGCAAGRVAVQRIPQRRRRCCVGCCSRLRDLGGLGHSRNARENRQGHRKRNARQGGNEWLLLLHDKCLLVQGDVALLLRLCC